MGVPEEFVIAADGPGDLFIVDGIIGGMVDDEGKGAVDGRDVGSIAHPFHVGRIVGVRVEASP